MCMYECMNENNSTGRQIQVSDSISNVLVTLPADILNSKLQIKYLPCMYIGNNSSDQRGPGKICHQSSPFSFPIN